MSGATNDSDSAIMFSFANSRRLGRQAKAKKPEKHGALRRKLRFERLDPREKTADRARHRHAPTAASTRRSA